MNMKAFGQSSGSGSSGGVNRSGFGFVFEWRVNRGGSLLPWLCLFWVSFLAHCVLVFACNWPVYKSHLVLSSLFFKIRGTSNPLLNLTKNLSCLVSSRLVLSCLVLSCLVLSCLVLSCLVLSCLVLSCLALSHLGS